ncbi:periplasmic binding protein-like I [Catenaria anguillulae PL171]|uniref:Periplasmic binding protein-like I n=1 Tax=Catenaria anguillulae PL171 TaxID=765915 RepID=A0A1Y2HRH8_9FUNG|nr:periplasmic binding protein-like I [Catenaria anguillulae PL171]
MNGTRADEGTSVFAAQFVVRQGVVGILGGGSSGSAAQISLVTRSLKIPVCSMVAASSTLSNKKEHPWFYRYIATSKTQAQSTLDLMRYANWSQFSLVYEGGNPFVQSCTIESRVQPLH